MRVAPSETPTDTAICGHTRTLAIAKTGTTMTPTHKTKEMIKTKRKRHGAEPVDGVVINVVVVVVVDAVVIVVCGPNKLARYDMNV